MRLKRAILAAAVAALALGAGFLLLRPAPASGLENGRFEADCCGTIELRDGEMVLNGRQSVRYDVGHDPRGPSCSPALIMSAASTRAASRSTEPARRRSSGSTGCRGLGRSLSPPTAATSF
ncbi:MAG TPA: hypothetical protein VFR28_00885 [Allosphingosinicella sp.]|jgi:hypothetical protein|nr:hypothetical protein [Allosphingosinicella sp.]